MEELLRQILNELQQQRSPLGFGASPTPKYIYANIQPDGTLWYHWNHAENKPEPIRDDCLTCKVLAVKIKSKEFKGKEKPKLLVSVMGDRPYIIETGIETVFAKSLLTVLAQTPATTLKRPISITVQAGDSEKVLFCRVYDADGAKLMVNPYGENEDWGAVIAAAISNVEAAAGKQSIPDTEKVTPRPAAPDLVLTPPPVEGEKPHGGVVDKIKDLFRRASTLEQVDQAHAWAQDERQMAAIAAIPGIYADVARWKAEASRRVMQSTFASTPENDVSSTLIAIEAELDRLKWTKEDGKKYLLEKYGVRSRQQLTDAQLVEFLTALKALEVGRGDDWDDF
jgi:hypothetical protein